MKRPLPKECACGGIPTHWLGAEGECDKCEALRHQYEHRRKQDEATLKEDTLNKKEFVRQTNKKYQESFCLCFHLSH